MDNAPAGQLTENSTAEPKVEIQIDDSVELLSRIDGRLDDLESQAAEYHRRSLHRETVIDRLHEENQKLRDEVRSSVFDPIATDLIRLYDGLRRDVERLRESHADSSLEGLLQSYADDVEQTLERCGLEPFSATVGEPFRRGEHVIVGTVDTKRPDRNNTIAEVLAAGFRDRATGRIKRPLRASFYRLDGPAEK
jgi:molecular chaperone GrpE (heat shock protein)